MIMKETNLAFSLNFHSNFSSNLNHIKFILFYLLVISLRKSTYSVVDCFFDPYYFLINS